jgi:tRNA-specific 2-thiouridylase
LKALSLFSGGLDSILATKLLQLQGIEMEGVCFVSPFFDGKKAIRAAENLKIRLYTVYMGEDLLTLLLSPPHGFGKGANPCVDCHILMVKKAASLMQKLGANFLVSGEVLGERPKSQSRWALNVVNEESGWGDYLLRPLTAKNLSPTFPEKRGWVKRDQLLRIKGRTRVVQLRLAESLGISDFPTPAGGCLLTDPVFSKRVKDLLARGKLNLNEIELLKIGRHFRLEKTAKLIVARNKEENKKILGLATPGDFLLVVVCFPGPVGLLRGEPHLILKAASVTSRYSDAPPTRIKVKYYQSPHTEERYVEVNPAEDEELEALRIGGGP